VENHQDNDPLGSAGETKDPLDSGDNDTNSDSSSDNDDNTDTNDASPVDDKWDADNHEWNPDDDDEDNNNTDEKEQIEYRMKNASVHHPNQTKTDIREHHLHKSRIRCTMGQVHREDFCLQVDCFDKQAKRGQ
jgi:hypothetical protein